MCFLLDSECLGRRDHLRQASNLSAVWFLHPCKNCQTQPVDLTTLRGKQSESLIRRSPERGAWKNDLADAGSALLSDGPSTYSFVHHRGLTRRVVPGISRILHTRSVLLAFSWPSLFSYGRNGREKASVMMDEAIFHPFPDSGGKADAPRDWLGNLTLRTSIREPRTSMSMLE